MSNPFHKPAGHHRPIRERSVSQMSVAERFALMLGKPLSDDGKRIVDHLTGKRPITPTKQPRQ